MCTEWYLDCALSGPAEAYRALAVHWGLTGHWLCTEERMVRDYHWWSQMRKVHSTENVRVALKWEMVDTDPGPRIRSCYVDQCCWVAERWWRKSSEWSGPLRLGLRFLQ